MISRNPLRSLLKRTGLGGAPLMLPSQEASHLNGPAKQSSRFVLTKRNDFLIIDQKKPPKRRKGSGPQPKLQLATLAKSAAEICSDGCLNS